MQDLVGSIVSVGAVGSLYWWLKDRPFRDLLFWSLLLFDALGLIDLISLLRLNLKIGFPCYFFVAMDEDISMMINERVKWQPSLVVSSKLFPAGIEDTFFALLMSIDHVGLLSSTWVGGLLLKSLRATHTDTI
ncbi:hypothetical protein NC652_009633 [Populus alba x Populus x berolinensis]|nr:hypothetical protein NC652_009633 [Populus alba x Populus x berolinensis]